MKQLRQMSKAELHEVVCPVSCFAFSFGTSIVKACISLQRTGKPATVATVWMEHTPQELADNQNPNCKLDCNWVS